MFIYMIGIALLIHGLARGDAAGGSGQALLLLGGLAILATVKTRGALRRV